MFWEKRKEKAAKYKVENENLAVPEIHLKGDDDADPAEAVSYTHLRPTRH